MTGMDVLVVIVFALLGYWIVSAVMNHVEARRANAHGNFGKRERGTDHTFGGENTWRENWGKSKESEATQSESIHTSWFTILGVPEGATREQVTAAYKQKISQYHPDTVAQMGTEIRELAELKSKEINAAHDYAMRLRR